MVKERRNASTASLTPLLEAASPSWEELHANYGPLLELVDTLLGVVPNCDRYLEIWPPAFRTYNVMVPNLLNLPAPIIGIGGPPPHIVGLAMYVASRTAGCAYCTAHSCSFAMRRGASPEQVAAALLPGAGDLSREELAAVAVARSLAGVPAELTTGERDELVAAFGPANAEWIVLAISMMGFLNKFMDVIGVELESAVAAEVTPWIDPSWTPGKAGTGRAPAMPNVVPTQPPVDGLRSRLRLLPLLPAAVRYDRRVQRGVPSGRLAVAEFLEARTGAAFPVLSALRSNRARRSIATMIMENLDASTSIVGLPVKVAAGAELVKTLGNRHLAHDVDALLARLAVDVGSSTAPPDEKAEAILELARAAATSPASTDEATVDACADAGLEPAAIVEVVTWLALLQLLHRLSTFTLIDDQIGATDA
jgi:alkylhydroperoxidase family enzyme